MLVPDTFINIYIFNIYDQQVQHQQNALPWFKDSRIVEGMEGKTCS